MFNEGLINFKIKINSSSVVLENSIKKSATSTTKDDW
jgi:hypothetical protein